MPVMPEPANRDEEEKNLALLFWLIWMDWSDVPSHTDLSKLSLRDLIYERTQRPVRNIWQAGYYSTLSQFGGLRSPVLENRYFQLYYNDLVSSITDRWMSRIDQYAEDQASDRPYRPRWEHVRGRGQEVIYRPPFSVERDETPRTQEQYGPTGVLEEWDGAKYMEFYDPRTNRFSWVTQRIHPQDPRRTIGARPIVYPSDVDSEAINWVTGTNTFGEFFGVRQAEAQGSPPIARIWQTERDRKVCPVCFPLHGTQRGTWSRVAPNGPPAHPRCRCWLEYAARFV